MYGVRVLIEPRTVTVHPYTVPQPYTVRKATVHPYMRRVRRFAVRTKSKAGSRDVAMLRYQFPYMEQGS
jgi:hypothetical protein